MKRIISLSIPTFLIVSVILGGIGLAADYYAKITTYYYVPEDHTFNIAFPSTYTGGYNVTAANTTLANWISFNFTGVGQNWIQPYTNGSSGNTQNGAATPIFLIYNTGNGNSVMRLNTTTMSDFEVCSNSTCAAGCSGTVSTCTAIEGSSLISMGTVNTGSKMNITLYANSTAGAAQGQQSGETYIQASV